MTLTRHPAGATGHPSYRCFRYHKCRCPDCMQCQHVVRERYYAKLRAKRQYPMPTLIARLYREVLGVKYPKSK